MTDFPLSLLFLCFHFRTSLLFSFHFRFIGILYCVCALVCVCLCVCVCVCVCVCLGECVSLCVSLCVSVCVPVTDDPCFLVSCHSCVITATHRIFYQVAGTLVGLIDITCLSRLFTSRLCEFKTLRINQTSLRCLKLRNSNIAIIIDYYSEIQNVKKFLDFGDRALDSCKKYLITYINLLVDDLGGVYNLSFLPCFAFQIIFWEEGVLSFNKEFYKRWLSYSIQISLKNL